MRKQKLKLPAYCHSSRLHVAFPSKSGTQSESDSEDEPQTSDLNDSDDLTQETQEKLVSLSERSKMCLELGRVDSAVITADEALEINPVHVKSLYWKAQALIAGGEYLQAMQCLELAVSQKRSGQLQLEKNRCRILCEQSMTGVYYRENLSKLEAAPACADYVGPVVVKAGQHGRGLFLTEDVKKGQLLLVSNPIAAVHETVEYLFMELFHVCQGSSKARAQLRTLAYSHDQTDRLVPSMDLFKPNSSWPFARDSEQRDRIDREQVANAIKLAGCFFGETKWIGVWGLPGFINHSCSSNVTRSSIGRAMLVRAARDLSAWEELFSSYVYAAAPWLEFRKEECFQQGFYCTCERCKVEQKYEHLLKQVQFKFELPLKITAAECLGVVARMEEALHDVPDKDKRLIRAGYIEAYLNCSPEDLCKVTGCPRLEEILDILEEACPGTGLVRAEGNVKWIRDVFGKRRAGIKARSKLKRGWGQKESKAEHLNSQTEVKEDEAKPLCGE